jgi:hypothetical protein
MTDSGMVPQVVMLVMRTVCDNGSHEDGGVMQERGEDGGPTPLHHTSEAWPRTALSSFWGAFFFWGTMC